MSNKKLIVVIHIIHEDYLSIEDNLSIEDRTLKQVKIAFNNGADGVFLTIGEGGLSPELILKCYNYIRIFYPTNFIGINFMCDPIKSASTVPLDANALWIDKGLGQVNYIDEITKVKNILTERQWKGLYFGGFCLKGNNQILFENHSYFSSLHWNPEKYFDVCVTSGFSTGVSIDNKSLEIVKNKSNGVSLALASGININNISNFINSVDYFVVGTGVEKDSIDPVIINFYKEAGIQNPVMVGYLDDNKIKKLSEIIKSY
jgi:hypothetical protein